MVKTLFALLMLLISSSALAQSIPNAAAMRVFDAANRVNARDGGKLWGTAVCGPIFVVDPDTRYVVANRADTEGKLKKSENVWTGQLPQEITPANSATKWAGVEWTMLMWPVPQEPRDLERLVGHECYHRIQTHLKLEPKDAVAAHLDSKDGRIWLQLEWRALERALVTEGAARKAAVQDALRFRNYRRAILKSAEESEDALEMNEGLAEYTGYRLAFENEADRRAAAVYALHAGPLKQSFGRSFAYVSGPAYGILLDASGMAWRSSLKPDGDWGVLLARAYGVLNTKIAASSADLLATKYQGETLIASEAERAAKFEAKRAEIRRRFVEGPVLALPIDEEFGYGFNPNDTVSLDENATFYGWARITGKWGALESSSGVLLIRQNGRVVRVTVPAAKDPASAQSEDWKLTLKPGWRIVGAGKPGDQTLQKQ